MSNIRPLYYFPIATGSHAAPLPIELRRLDGSPANLADAAITVRVVDERTGEIIVDGRAATVLAPSTLGRADFFFTAEDVAKITASTTWLVQWTVTSPTGVLGVYPAEPIKLFVRPAL